MAELKTKPNPKSVAEFINSIENEQRRNDCIVVHDLMKKVTQTEAVMWGESIVGFGKYRYKYASGREGDWFWVGLSPRKQNLTLYIIAGFSNAETLLQKLGKHKVSGGSCLYVNKLSDLDLGVLEELIRQSVEALQKLYPGS